MYQRILMYQFSCCWSSLRQSIILRYEIVLSNIIKHFKFYFGIMPLSVSYLNLTVVTYRTWPISIWRDLQFPFPILFFGKWKLGLVPTIYKPNRTDFLEFDQHQLWKKMVYLILQYSNCICLHAIELNGKIQFSKRMTHLLFITSKN